ncbi:CRISPR-associated endonuclease Cas2 [Arhodomonas sp. AD133]|uniref:CRISPR-associated endonuclease Cas2 n=1 Tax=Arhodomonas sp. AD133 TaxID=3415009 RepID=UPI003EBF47C3
MKAPRLYIVAYDIADQKRWRRVFRLMHGYGDWLQLSVFQCRLDDRRHAELVGMVNEIIHANEDHVLIMDMGPAENVEPRITSLGKAQFEPVQRQAVIV